MSKQLHHPEDPHTFEKGANTDVDAEDMARTPGLYVDALNARIAGGGQGKDGSARKIKGETLIWDAQDDGASTYVCIGAIEVQGQAVEFWASSEPLLYPPLIRIDGVTMVKSFEIPYLANKPLDLDRNEDCEGGMVFDAKSGAVPMFWDIGDIKAQYLLGSAVYFSGFVLVAHQMNLTIPVDRPELRQVVDVGAGGGLKPGQYCWAMRYADSSGNVSQTGPDTFMMSIPLHIGPRGTFNDATGFPGASLVGGSIGDIDVRTPYGMLLRQRINNPANFSRIEIIRTEWNLGLGVDAVPVTYVVHQRAILPGEVDWFEWTDRGDFVSLIPADEQPQLYYIKEANSVRYMSYRVEYGGVKVGAREINPTYTEVAGKRTFPVTHNMGKFGHADMINNAKYKKFTSGERYWTAIGVRDGAGGKSFAALVEQVEMPLRRDLKISDPATYSDHDIWATTVDHEVNRTFEIFDHDEAIAKSDSDHVVNIMEDGYRFTTGMGPAPYGPGVVPGPNMFGNPTTATNQILPLRPTRYDDPDKLGHNYKVNTAVRNNYAGGDVPYAPKVHEPNFHSLGMGMYGVDGLPDYWQGFEMLRSKPAMKEVMKGLGIYVLQDNSPLNSASKEQVRINVFFPDMEAGMPDTQAIKENLLANPSLFRIRMDAPLGFSSELMASVNKTNSDMDLEFATAHLCDMMSWARIQWDAGQINPIPWTAGVQPLFPGPPGLNYPDFGAWRNAVPPTSPWHAAGYNGSRLFTPINAAIYTDDTGAEHIVLTLDTAIYANPNAAANGEFTHPLTAAFHEPFYAVSLIQEGAQPSSTEGFIPTGWYQRRRALIGIGNGLLQDMVLIDERPEDILGTLPSDFRYIHITLADGTPQTWVCITNNTFVQSDLAIIQADIAGGGWIAPDGTVVTGIYEVIQVAGDWTARFGTYGYFVPQDARVEIWYDNTAPFLFWGGESTIAPAMFPACDKIVHVSADVTTQAGFQLPWPIDITESSYAFPLIGLPLPFRWFTYNPRYWVPYSGLVPEVSNNNILSAQLSTLRQWMILFDCEVRAPIHLNYFDFTTNEVSFPNIHNVLRPYRWDVPTTGANSVFPAYDVIYPGEADRWGEGGIKWRRHLNLDYAAMRGYQYNLKPPFYLERTNLCNALIHSAKADPTAQDSPGLRTFPVTNRKFIDDGAGDITKLYSALGPRGYNIYVLTEHGVCVVLTEKSTLYSADGQALSQLRSDRFFADEPEIWLSKESGLAEVNWREYAEASTFVGEAKTRHDTLFFYDAQHNSMAMLVRDQVVDILKGSYENGFFATTAPGRGSAGVFDQKNNEVLIVHDTHMNVFACDKDVHNWTGRYAYSFDEYLYAGRRLLGFRNLQTFELDRGNNINGQPVEFRLTVASAPFPGERMEWDRIKVVSDAKPDRIEFINENGVVDRWMDQATFGPLYLLKEAGWEHFVPSGNASVYPTDPPPLQGRVAKATVIHRAIGDFKMSALVLQVKKIK